VLQHLDDRLSGDPHRSELPRPDRDDDLSRDYGINEEDLENARPFLAGFIVREASRIASNFRASGSLGDFLRKHNIVALEGIDTRALVRRLRSRGAMKGVLSTTDLDDASLVAKAQASPGLVGRDLVREVVPAQPREWDAGLSRWHNLQGEERAPCEQDLHVVALDFGMKCPVRRPPTRC
jgi:carbamoyl-phosphate synthase small subunit